MNTDENPTTNEATPAPSVPRPEWGLTYAIPEGVTISWGARAIYSWRDVTKTVGHKRKLTSTTREPVIDLLWDRMGFADVADQPGERRSTEQIERIKTFGAWIDAKGLPEIKAACLKRQLSTSADGLDARVAFTGDGYAIMACPNGSHGYLYIAAWKVVQ